MDENICITFYVLLYVKGFLLGKHHKSDCVDAPHPVLGNSLPLLILLSN